MRWLFIFTILLTEFALAKTIFIKDKTVTEDEFKARLMAHSDRQAFSDWSFESASKTSQQSGLDKEFLSAQKLAKSKPAEAFEIFEKIYERRHQTDYAEMEREILAKTCETLASLEKDGLRRQRLIAEAASFRSLKKNQTRKRIRLDRSLPRQILKDFSFATVNGQRLDWDESFAAPAGSFRLTLYSNSYLPYSAVVSRSDLENLNPLKKIIATGLCSTGFFSRYSEMQMPQQALIAASKCDAKLDARVTQQERDLAKQVSLRQASAGGVPKWVWWTVGAVAGVAVIQSMQSGEKRTTHREGF